MSSKPIYICAFCYLNTHILKTSIDIYILGSTCVRNSTKKLPWCVPGNYDKKKPPFLFTDDETSDMNLHFTFSVREVSKVTDEDQTLQIPMYFTVSWTEDRLVVDQVVTAEIKTHFNQA